MERQTVSGWWTAEACAWVNQVWNWVKGEGSSWERERVPLVYWSARAEEVWGPAGATGGGDGEVSLGCEKERWEELGLRTDEFAR